MISTAKTYTCDLCDKVANTTGDSPKGWEINVKIICFYRRARADICAECFRTVFPDYKGETAFNNLDKGTLQRPWWKKFFGLEKRTES